MLAEHWNNYEAEIDSLSISQLRENIARRVYAGEHLNVAYFVLEKKEKEEANIKWEQNLDLAEKNVKSTRGLVRATWSLVIITFLLVLITYFSK